MRYEVTTWNPPPDTPVPHPDVRGVRIATAEDLGCAGRPYDGLSIGCSNTGYP